MKTIWLFCLSFFFIIPFQPIYAENTLALQTKEVVVLFEEPLKAAAEEAVDVYPAVKGKLEQTLGWRVNFRPTVLLVKDSKSFQEMVGSNLIVAFAVVERNLVVIDYSKMTGHPFSLEMTMKHELCHLLLHDHIERKDLPRWLDEGIAQWVSDGMAEIIIRQKRSALNEAILAGRIIPIRALTQRFPRDGKSLYLAYEESKSLVEYIIANYGKHGILAVLNHLRDGDQVDTAISKGLSISFDELERRWQEHLKETITWWTYLINYLYEILFFLAALIMVYGFIRVWIRKRTYKYEEQD